MIKNDLASILTVFFQICPSSFITSSCIWRGPLFRTWLTDLKQSFGVTVKSWETSPKNWRTLRRPSSLLHIQQEALRWKSLLHSLWIQMTLFIRVLITEPQCHLSQPCYVCLMHHSRMVSTGSRWMPLYRVKVMVCKQQSSSSRWLSSLLGQLAIKRGATSVFSPRAGAYVRKQHKTHRHTQLYFLDQISILPEWLSGGFLRD